jgi:hypothetical protein
VEPTEIRVALERRGTELGKPVDEQRLKSAERQLRVSLAQFCKCIYSEFNGIRTYDNRSHISLWPLARIIEQQKLSIMVDDRTYFAMGDILIDSDFVMCCLEDESAPLFLLYENRELAPTARAFFERLVSGGLDF